MLGFSRWRIRGTELQKPMVTGTMETAINMTGIIAAFIVVVAIIIIITVMMRRSFCTATVGILLLISMTTYISFINYGIVYPSQTQAVQGKAKQRNYLTEEEALRDEPITDIRQATYLKYSIIHLVEERAIFNVGDRILVTIVLKNDFQMKKKKGGDKLEVRIFNPYLQAAAAGHVIDYDNGTYLAIVDALWPGKHTIMVTLAFRRELIRAVYAGQAEHKTGSTIHGLFDSGSIKEETICHPKPEGLTQYNYTDLCNLTMDNSGSSWYCGKPVNQKILCEDWTSIRSVRNGMEITDNELALQRFGPETFPNISVTVKGSKMERKLLTACSSVPKRHTWSEETLTGFFYNNKWFPQYCTIPEKMNIRKCLKDKRLILFGDSTIRHWYKHLMEDFACVAVTEYWTKEKWHKRSSCEIKRMNFTMEWIPHAQPFHVGLKWDTKRYTTHSIASQIDGLANNANVIVVIHMFSHVSAYHHSVFRDRMRIISKSVHRFLRRNKNAHIFIKSPHTHKHIGSFFGYVYRDIIQEEFKDLQDDIVYLNQADMTIAKINVDVHPPMDIVAAAVKQMLGFVCV